MYDKYKKFRSTKNGNLIAGVVAVIFLFIFATWAIDSGSLLHYGLAFFFLFDALVSFTNIFRVQNVEPTKKNVNKRKVKKTA